MREGMQPPRWPNKLLQAVLKDHLVEEIEGDLLEFYEDWRTEYGPRKANRLYVLHALKFLRPFALKPLTKLIKINPGPMYKDYLKIAWRQIRKHEAQALFNITGLALGLLVVALTSLWIWDEVSFNTYHERHDRIARVMQNQTFAGGDIQTMSSQPKQLAPLLREDYGIHFDHVSVASYQEEQTLFYDDEVLTKTGMFMEPSGPHLLGLNMMVGNRNSLRGINSLVISESAAIALFGNDDPIGKVVGLGNLPEVTVTGVYEDLPANSSYANLDFVAPWKLYEQMLPEWIHWGNNWFQTLVQIKESGEMKVISATIKDAKLRHIDETTGAGFRPQLFLHPMGDWHLYSQFENGIVAGGRIQYVKMFGAIGLFVLILACVNFINLTTARSERRAKEVGIRKAIGSNRKQLITQFIVETMLISGIAFVVSLIGTLLVLPYFNEVTNKQLSIPWVNPVFWAVSFSIILITSLLAGSYPAFYLSAFRAIRVLKGTVSVGRASTLPRKAMVMVQFTVSIALMVGTVFVYKQIHFVKQRPMGYSTQNLITLPMKGPELQESFEVFRDELLKTGMISEVSRSSSSVTQAASTNSGLSWEGKDPDMQDEFLTVKVNHEFGKTVAWEIIEGRDFSRDHQTDRQGVIINQAAAEYMGMDDPIGKVLDWGMHGKYTVLGVVKNLITQSPYDPVKQTIFFQEYKGPSKANVVNIRFNAGVDMQEALTRVDGIYKTFDAENPFEYQFVSEQHDRKFRSEEQVVTLSGFFSLLAIAISFLGLYGMSSFVVARKTKEIGVRKILGASVSRLWSQLSAEFILLVVISSVLGSVLAYYFVYDWLQQFTYHTNLSLWVFLAAASAAIIIALCTVSYHTVRAATLNPVKCLRSE